MSYWSDVQEQPQVLHALLQTYQQGPIWSQLLVGSGLIVLTGMGASFNALYPAWFFLNQQGKTALHLETSTLIHYLPALLDTCEVIVAVSQSGESIEIKKLVEQLEARRQQDLKTPFLVSVTNSDQNTLADYCEVSLPTFAGSEVGIATKTYMSSMLMLNFVAKALVGQLQNQDFETGAAIATLCQDWLDKIDTGIEEAVEAFQSITYMALIGRGPALATAHNGALIFKEGVRLPAEGYSGGQFRHGPREMIADDLGLLVLTSPDTTLDLNLRLATDILGYGGRLVCIGQPGPLGGVSIRLPSTTDPLYYPILEILPIQLLAAQMASVRHLEPGEFRWSGKVVDHE